MKKVYIKPKLYAETFSLAEHIAGVCVIDKDNGIYATFSADNARTGGSCTFVDSNIAVFANGYCLDTLEELGEVDCYNAFSNNDSMFSS